MHHNFCFNSARIYLLRVNNSNTRTRCRICSKLTIKTPINNKDTNMALAVLVSNFFAMEIRYTAYICLKCLIMNEEI